VADDERGQLAAAGSTSTSAAMTRSAARAATRRPGAKSSPAAEQPPTLGLVALDVVLEALLPVADVDLIEALVEPAARARSRRRRSRAVSRGRDSGLA
jgi:hypothetical protein